MAWLNAIIAGEEVQARHTGERMLARSHWKFSSAYQQTTPALGKVSECGRSSQVQLVQSSHFSASNNKLISFKLTRGSVISSSSMHFNPQRTSYSTSSIDTAESHKISHFTRSTQSGEASAHPSHTPHALGKYPLQGLCVGRPADLGTTALSWQAVSRCRLRRW